MRILTTLKERFLPTVQARDLNTSAHCVPLDGVRGLAILMVLCYDCLKIPYHGDPLTMVARKFSASGWIGVDLFFVLSGFLITGILLDTRGKQGYWKSFFLRRSVRIFPLYYATLLGVFVGIPLLVYGGYLSSEQIPASLHADRIWYLFYGQNWLFAIRGAWPEERVLNHFWSLAVEEQFYLVWPIIVAWLSRKSLMRLCLTLCGCAVAIRFALLLNGTPGVSTYVMTITRMDSLCAGGLLAIAFRNPEWKSKYGRWLPIFLVASCICLVGIDVVWPVLESQSFAAYSIGHTLLAISFVACIGSVVLVRKEHLLARAFSIKPLLSLGKYSYAIYVFHRFVYAGVLKYDWSSYSEAVQGWLIFIATLLGSLLVAQVSWKLLEQPCLGLKKYFPRPDEGVAQNAYLASSVLSATIGGCNDSAERRLPDKAMTQY